MWSVLDRVANSFGVRPSRGSGAVGGRCSPSPFLDQPTGGWPVPEHVLAEACVAEAAVQALDDCIGLLGAMSATRPDCLSCH